MSIDTDLIEKYSSYNNFGKLLGMELTEINQGKITYRLVVTEQHLATPHAAHGGLIAALMDGMLGVAALSLVAHDNKVVSTVEYKTSFYSPALLGDILEGKAWVDKPGKRIVFSIGEIIATNRNNIVIAKGSGTNIQEVNKLIKQFDETRKMMRMMQDKNAMAKMMRNMPKMGQ